MRLPTVTKESTIFSWPGLKRYSTNLSSSATKLAVYFLQKHVWHGCEVRLNKRKLTNKNDFRIREVSSCPLETQAFFAKHRVQAIQNWTKRKTKTTGGCKCEKQSRQSNKIWRYARAQRFGKLEATKRTGLWRHSNFFWMHLNASCHYTWRRAGFSTQLTEDGVMTYRDVDMISVKVLAVHGRFTRHAK